MKKIYKGKIRDGIYGQFTKEDYEVVIDQKYGYARLNEFPKIDYKSSSYRELVNNTKFASEYLNMHDKEQAGYFNFVYKHLSRDLSVIDCGCGGGSFLDLIKGMVKRTYAVEPYEGYHKSLKDRNHEVYSSLEIANKEIKDSVDLALSFQVIEHVEDPLNYIKNIYNILATDGKLILFTPNLNDIMLKLHFDIYAPFFFRTVHNYYFTADSLIKLSYEAGFTNHEVLYYHNFGLNNVINWIKHDSPKKNQLVEGINDQINNQWIHYLESTGQSYNVGLVLSKKNNI